MLCCFVREGGGRHLRRSFRCVWVCLLSPAAVAVEAGLMKLGDGPGRDLDRMKHPTEQANMSTHEDTTASTPSTLYIGPTYIHQIRNF